MREARWVNRFHFAWNDTPFYDPIDTHYQLRDEHFLHALPAEQRALFERFGLWWSYRHNPNLPMQGWKIHVSATYDNAREVFRQTASYLIRHGIDFKVALDMNILELLNSKAASRGSSGKFITIYPQTDAEFAQTLRDLEPLLQSFEGPYILSDMRYRDAKCLYFRYGQFQSEHRLDAMGRKHPMIRHPDGQLIPDDRAAQFSMPDWVTWPIADWHPSDDVSDGDVLLGQRFCITEAVSFSNSGGVYKAQDTHDGDRTVIVKEARPHANFNARLRYHAVDILNREWQFLNLLSDAGVSPRPVAMFDEWEHRFLVEEYVTGADIRKVLFDHNPLVRPRVTLRDSRAYLKIFLTLFANMARAIQEVHARGIVLGDLTANNFIIHEADLTVTLIDLEGCRLVSPQDAAHGHLERTVDLYTPGFRHAKRWNVDPTFEDDLFGLASIMGYFVFTIAAMAYLRQDTFEVYRAHFEALGWPDDIHDLILRLSRNEATLRDVIRLHEQQDRLVNEVRVIPRTSRSRQPRRVQHDRVTDLHATRDALKSFLMSSADLNLSTLFPSDPFAHVTNPLSFGFGASGTLHALADSGEVIPAEWIRWLRDRALKLPDQDVAAGFMNGLAGLSWTLRRLGDEEAADTLLDRAHARALADGDYTLYYGLAGVGLTHLNAHLVTRSERHLRRAVACADELLTQARQDHAGLHWTNEFTPDAPFTGLGYGQSGVALFLLRLHQLTRTDRYLQAGQRALAWDVSRGVKWRGGVLFEEAGTREPYLEVGSAGVAKVMLRYGERAAVQPLLRAIHANFTVMPGYLFGHAGLIDTMLDAAVHLNDPRCYTVAMEQYDHLRRVFMFTPPGVNPGTQLAVPGDGLLRCACDFGTGVAGVLHVAQRLIDRRSDSLLLDEVSR